MARVDIQAGQPTAIYTARINANRIPDIFGGPIGLRSMTTDNFLAGYVGFEILEVLPEKNPITLLV